MAFISKISYIFSYEGILFIRKSDISTAKMNFGSWYYISLKQQCTEKMATMIIYDFWLYKTVSL